jgi:hypothetical protein
MGNSHPITEVCEKATSDMKSITIYLSLESESGKAGFPDH